MALYAQDFQCIALEGVNILSISIETKAKILFEVTEVDKLKKKVLFYDLEFFKIKKTVFRVCGTPWPQRVAYKKFYADPFVLFEKTNSDIYKKGEVYDGFEIGLENGDEIKIAAMGFTYLCKKELLSRRDFKC